MSIATRTGDDGNTRLFGGRRVPKDDPRVEAYGTVDELNALVGMTRSQGLAADLARILERLQSELFDLGAELATPREGNAASGKVPAFPASALDHVDRDLEELEGLLPPLTAFILPGGHPAAAWLHLCRTACREAERRAVALAREERLPGVVLQYLNRLSDLFFLMARAMNQREGVAEPEWRGREDREAED